MQKRNYENVAVICLAVLVLFAANFLPKHIQQKQIEHEKKEIQKEKIKVGNLPKNLNFSKIYYNMKELWSIEKTTKMREIYQKKLQEAQTDKALLQEELQKPNLNPKEYDLITHNLGWYQFVINQSNSILGRLIEFGEEKI